MTPIKIANQNKELSADKSHDSFEFHRSKTDNIDFMHHI